MFWLCSRSSSVKLIALWSLLYAICFCVVTINGKTFLWVELLSTYDWFWLIVAIDFWYHLLNVSSDYSWIYYIYPVHTPLIHVNLIFCVDDICMCNFIQFNSFHCCIFQSRTQRIMGFFLFLLLGIFCFVMVSFKQCIHDRTRQGWHKLCHWFWWNLASLKGSTQNYFSLSLRKFGQKWGLTTSLVFLKKISKNHLKMVKV